MTWARRIQESREQREQSRQERMARPSTVAPLHRGVYAPVSSVPMPEPKPEPYRDPALLDMARGRPCLLLVPGVCNARIDTTVAAHSNLAEHGKGGARKADDVFSVWACFACHTWLDQGPAQARQKRFAFMGAQSRQVLAWREVASDPTEPPRFRAAALRALEWLNATPITEDE